MVSENMAQQPEPRPNIYYENHPRAAFAQDFVQQFDHVTELSNVKYSGYGVFIPTRIIPMVKRVRRYFEELDKYPEEASRRRRKNPLEYIETAVNMLYRAHNLCAHQAIPIGSQHLSPLAWAVIGPNIEGMFARNYFDNIESLYAHYDNWMNGSCKKQLAYFTNGFERVTELSRFYTWSRNRVIAVALVFLHDLIQHGGPDCDHFYDLYTNDQRCCSVSGCLPDWQRARAKVFVGDKMVTPLPGRRVVVAEWRPRPMKVETTIEEIDCGDDLSAGELTSKVVLGAVLPIMTLAAAVRSLRADEYFAGDYDNEDDCEVCKYQEDGGICAACFSRIPTLSPRHLK